MLATLLFLTVSTFQGAEKYAVSVLSQKTGGIKGSAVLIHKQAALTAAHVVGEVGDLTTLGCHGAAVHGVVTKRSQLLDLALVEFDEECDVPVAGLAKMNPPTGSAVTPVGFPGGEFLTVGHGTVASYEVLNAANGFPRLSILIDAAIFPGHSGGPLFNDVGGLSGTITGRVCLNDPEQPSQCWGSVVPVSLIRIFLAMK
jgi:S1-C subfamily serine protease